MKSTTVKKKRKSKSLEIENSGENSGESLGKAEYRVAVLIEETGFEEEIDDLESFCIESCIATLLDTPLPHHFENIELVVSLSNDNMVKDLNNRFRGQDKPTNVLSFPNSNLSIYNYRDFPAEHLLLGDIIIAYETVKREAEAANKPFADHLRHLLIHATLHLMGYDHKIEADAELMESLEIALLEDFGIKDPYIIED